jgi:hypothetical protein
MIPFSATPAAWRYSPRSAAASAGINTAVLSQKRLERLTVGISLWINTEVLSYFLADPLE